MAHEFVKQPLPFPKARSHICLKLAGSVGETTAGGLSNVNAACGNPVKMLCPRLTLVAERQAEENTDEY